MLSLNSRSLLIDGYIKDQKEVPNELKLLICYFCKSVWEDSLSKAKNYFYTHLPIFLIGYEWDFDIQIKPNISDPYFLFLLHFNDYSQVVGLIFESNQIYFTYHECDLIIYSLKKHNYKINIKLIPNLREKQIIWIINKNRFVTKIKSEDDDFIEQLTIGSGLYIDDMDIKLKK